MLHLYSHWIAFKMQLEKGATLKFRKILKITIGTTALLANIVSTGGVFWCKNDTNVYSEGLWKSCPEYICYDIVEISRHLKICQLFSVMSCVLTFFCVVTLVLLLLKRAATCNRYVSIVQFVGATCNVISLVFYLVNHYEEDCELAWSYYFGWVTTVLQLITSWLCCVLCTWWDILILTLCFLYIYL